MLTINATTSKAVGWEKQNIPYPTLDQVRKAEDAENGVKLLTWYRNLESPTTEDETTILDEINRIVVAAMKRR